MATKKTTIAAEIQIKPGDSAKTIGDLRNELNEIPKAASKAAEGSIAQLKELKKQLKNTAAGSEEFTKLFNQIDDLEDKLKGSKKASADWIDTLASAGGPVGALGNALNTAKVSMTSFGAALKASGIGLLVAVIGGLAAAFSQNEEAMKKLQPIMNQFGRILNGILGALEPIINAFLNLATKAMPYVTEAFGVAYSAISSFLQSLGYVGQAIGKLLTGDFKGAWDSAKKSVTEFKNNYDEAQKGYIKGTQQLTDKEKEEAEKRRLLKEAELEKQKKLNDEKLAEEQRVQDELLKQEIEAFEKRKKQRKGLSTEVVGMDGMTASERAAEEKRKKEAEEAWAKASVKLNEDLQKKLADGTIKLNQDTLISDMETTNLKIKLAEEERQYRVGAAQDIASAMVSLGSIIGEQTAAGKALGIASALINTYIGASEVLRAKSTLPEPFGTINKIANVAAIVATGIKSVKAITSVKVPNAGGAGGGGQNINSNIAAPLSPQAAVTTLNQAQVNQIGNIAAKAYVVESDVTGNQERIRRLNRAARIS